MCGGFDVRGSAAKIGELVILRGASPVSMASTLLLVIIIKDKPYHPSMLVLSAFSMPFFIDTDAAELRISPSRVVVRKLFPASSKKFDYILRHHHSNFHSTYPIQ